MPVPKKRKCHARKGLKHAHQALAAASISIDKRTKGPHRPHHIDLKTGFYDGKQVLFKNQEAAAAEGGTTAPASDKAGE